MLTARDIGDELSQARELRAFDHVAILVDSGAAPPVGGSPERIRSLEERIGARVSTVEVTQSLPTLPDDVDAAYLALGWPRPAEEIRKLAAGLAEARIPSYTARPSDVRAGIMAAFAVDNAQAQVLRKLSVMVDDHLSGEKMSEMSVAIRRERRLLLNSGTMRKVAFSPAFEILYSAEVILATTSEDVPTFQLPDVVTAALENSFDVELARTDIRTLELDYLTAVSFFLPGVSSSLGYTQFDESRSNFINPEQSLSANVTVEQVLFSQSLIAGIQLQSILTEAQRYATQRQIFDVLANVFEAYFAVLSERAILEVQTENLNVTRENLEIAELQQRLGESSAADVYRFEAEVASAQQEVVEAQLSFRVATQRLNLLTGYALPPRFDVEDITAEHALFIKTFNGSIGSRLSDRQSIQNFAVSLIEEALRNFPGKKELVATSRALKRRRASNNQAYFLPDFALVAQGGQPLWQGGIGSPETDDYERQWNITFQLTYPIFDGNRRYYELQQTALAQRQVQLETDALDASLQFRVARALADLVAAKTDINFSRTSSDATAKNFELVQSSYQQGAVPIVQVVEAQNAALNAEISYRLSLYGYLRAYFQLENTLGHYSLIATPEEQRDFEERLATGGAP
ncbi:MAG: TolC family protein [Myxococcota bacterium]